MLTVSEAAALLGVSEQRVRYLLKTGQRPGLPLAMQLTAAETLLYDTDARIRRAG